MKSITSTPTKLIFTKCISRFPVSSALLTGNRDNYIFYNCSHIYTYSQYRGNYITTIR